MLISKAARRYAIALLETAKDQKTVEETLKDILFIKNTVESSKELVVFLKSPVVKPSDKLQALETIFKSSLGKLVYQFISLVAEKERSAILEEIVNAFISEYNIYAGIIEVEIRSASALGESQVSELKKVLEKSTSKKVNLDLKEQPDLKGGLMVKIDDTVIDGTIKHKLEQLEKTLLANSVDLN
ncbi:MAG: ATP synthase F1 subunit delta [Balneolaceae bacterium]